MIQQAYTPTSVETIVVDVQGPKSYERLEGEPVEWFARFQHFMLQGRGRTVNAVYRAEAAQGNLKGRSGPCRATEGREIDLPGSWKAAIKKWDWYVRAAAYDLEQLEAEKKQVEADRAARRRQLLDDEWHDSQLMLGKARESLKHGHKFFERTTRLIPGKPQLQEVVNPKTGQTEQMLVRVDREVVYIEHKLGDVNRMLVDGGKKARMAVGLTTEKAQEAFTSLDAGEEMDIAAVDAELLQMFEQLGMNKAPKPALPEPSAPQKTEAEPPGAIEPPINLTGDLLPGFDY